MVSYLKAFVTPFMVTSETGYVTPKTVTRPKLGGEMGPHHTASHLNFFTSNENLKWEYLRSS